MDSEKREYRSIAVKVVLTLFVLGGLGIGALFLYVLVLGPRMWVQPNVRTFQAEVPAMPAGAIPINIPPTAPPLAEARNLPNPIAYTPENVARGKVYYQYYCIFCHGEIGDGNGYVGQSYIPKPTDLRIPKVQDYTDGELLRAMLVGIGHDPVLERVVYPDHRWYLVTFTRSLASIPPTQTTPATVAPDILKEIRSPVAGK